MTVSRRGLLRAAGGVVATGLAGCGTMAPARATTLAVRLRGPVDAGPPVSIPLAVEVSVQNVESKDVAVRDVDLVAVDEERQPVAERRLGDFSWREAATERRSVEEHETFLSTTTAYHAEWTLEERVTVERLPEWLTVRVGAVWFDEDPGAGAVDDGQVANAVDAGEVQASQPPPAFGAWLLEYAGERPVAATVEADQFRTVRFTARRGPMEDGLFLPDPTPTPTLSAADGTAGNGTTSDGSVPDETPTNSTGTGATTSTGDGTTGTDSPGGDG